MTWLLAAVLSATLQAPPPSSDVVAARAVFEKNLDAIRRRDKAAYLSTYWKSETLARTGADGISLGYAAHEKSAGENWPDTFDASDLDLVPLKPGVVYGTYRYRVRYDADEQTGISERIFLDTPDGWRIAMTSAFPAAPGTPPPPRALVGATLVDGTGSAPVPNATVVLRAGKVECAGRCAVPAGVTVVDARGLWITPGLVDTHVHFGQTGWIDARPDAVDVGDRYPYEKVAAELASNPDRFYGPLLCSGVTAVFDVGGYPWSVTRVKSRDGNRRAPWVAATGPLLSTIDFPVNVPAERQFIHIRNAETARAGVRYLAALGADAIKVWYIVTPDLSAAASEPVVAAAAEEARKAKLPLVVHATGLAEAKAAVRAGAKLLVHGVSEGPIDDEFLSLLKKHGTIYCPTLTVFGGYARLVDAIVSRRDPPAPDDPNGCADRTTLARIGETSRLDPRKIGPTLKGMASAVPELERWNRANLKRVVEAGIPIAMGTDAGNPLTLHGPSVYAEMEAMQAAGLTPMQVLVAATRGGARAMGVEKQTGTVEKGKSADLLVVAGDPTADAVNLRKVRYVVRGGVVRSIEELRATVAAAK